jgi:hypothetical protein
VKKSTFIFIFSIGIFLTVFSQNLLSSPWISYPSANQTEYGVYHFRKTISIEKLPTKFVIQVSADNRYNLFVNGLRVCYGPAKGDLKTYKYDVIDIAPFLKAGKNVLAALVYNGGADRPLAFVGAQTAFLLRAENAADSIVNTNASWKVLKNNAYKPISMYEMIYKTPWFYGFYACGAGDNVNAKQYPWDWEKADFDDSQWENAELLEFNGNEPWKLVPRNIAFLDNHLVQPVCIRKVTGVNIPLSKWDGTSKLSIPANTEATILVDFENFTMGYPELKVAGGENSSIKVKYAEALYEKVHLKGHRDSVNNLTMNGVWDIFHPDGKAVRTFRPLWQRTFRYVEFVVQTKDEPVDILSYKLEYSGYPYPEMSTFVSNDKKLNEVFDMCLRTFQLCSAETYYDTPYYEQLSYGGDNRPISGVSFYNSNDDRLLREAMRLYAQSENKSTGLMKSAYPSRFDFDHGTWGLAWIQSLHDYYLMRGDTAYVSQFTKSFDRTLAFYERYIDKKSGLIGKIRTNSFIDWSITKGAVPRENKDKEVLPSSMLSLYYAHTLDCTVKIYEALGLTEKAAKYEKISKDIKVAVFVTCWNADKQLFKDGPEQEIYSQHTNLLAILCDVVTPAMQKELLKRIVTYDKFDEVASTYFDFFLFKAMEKTDQEDLFLDNLGPWYKYIDRGFTTCGETGFASHDRSDCHAWSAHPAFYILSSVCGIKPMDVGFNDVIITPHLGKLTSIKASMPHLKGRISVDYKLNKGKLQAIITLSTAMKGTFNYGKSVIALKEGVNKLIINN